MKLSLCTITFRHHLTSLDDLAAWASDVGFDGIELWGAHARNLADHPQRNAAWLAEYGLRVPMISDYLPLDGAPSVLTAKTLDLCRLAGRWGARKIRSFAGASGSAETGAVERAELTARLRGVCHLTADHGIDLVIETHPGTLADRLSATQALIEAVDHPALKINFDVLHVWEGGDDPVAARAALAPHIAHYHLKNIRSRADLGVFAPDNVYAAAGKRDGMVPLFDGAMDYRRFFASFADPQADAALEWFGPAPFAVLRQDRAAVCACLGKSDVLAVGSQPIQPAFALAAPS